MQNPYDKYQISSKGTKRAPQKKTRVRVRNREVKKSSPSQFTLIMASFMGLLCSFYLFAYTDEFSQWLSKIEVGFTQSFAVDKEKSSEENQENGEKDAPLAAGAISGLKSGSDPLTMKNANVYEALKNKTTELEKKERQLALLEEDLQRQKLEIEKQLKEMNEMRRNISSKLETKMTADQESVEKLVGVYADMKPQNAANILAQMDEDLAVKVLEKMKKQNAAAILNYIEPKKAQTLSEKYAGLKK